MDEIIGGEVRKRKCRYERLWSRRSERSVGEKGGETPERGDPCR
jgi:hypothetical protein